MTNDDAAAFHQIKIRVAGLVLDGRDVALIQRTNGQGVVHHALPGGNVEPAEPLPGALRRELQEELGVVAEDLAEPPRFMWLLDAMVSRPGSTPPRKLHIVYRVRLRPGVRPRLKAFEDDDSVGRGEVVWVPFDQTGDLALFPPVPIAGLASSDACVDAGSAMLPALDDSSYRWL
ncbi:NUDIX hydrolase [Streptomyces sp. NPDC012794]|uniref:NUDIX hydrolase n=1 Tax=Streptomyces sp. NPDC012794 TaxID=3364850 RepID=UPI0036BABFEA